MSIWTDMLKYEAYTRKFGEGFGEQTYVNNVFPLNKTVGENFERFAQITPELGGRISNLSFDVRINFSDFAGSEEAPEITVQVVDSNDDIIVEETSKAPYANTPFSFNNFSVSPFSTLYVRAKKSGGDARLTVTADRITISAILYSERKSYFNITSAD